MASLQLVRKRLIAVEEQFPGQGDEIRSLSEEDSSDIVKGGPRLEEPLEEPISEEMRPRRIGSVAVESREQGGTQQGRARSTVAWGQVVLRLVTHGTAHIHDFCPFIYDPIRTNPLTVAQYNEQEFDP
jgi:hypothetical protein